MFVHHCYSFHRKLFLAVKSPMSPVRTDNWHAAQNELVGNVAQKTRFLEHLRSELAALQAATAPSRAALALDGTPASLPAEAQALSLPLYLIYSQLLAAQVRAVPDCQVKPYLRVWVRVRIQDRVGVRQGSGSASRGHPLAVELSSICRPPSTAVAHLLDC